MIGGRLLCWVVGCHFTTTTIPKIPGGDSEALRLFRDLHVGLTEEDFANRLRREPDGTYTFEYDCCSRCSAYRDAEDDA